MCLGDNSTLVCEDLHESAGNSVTVKIFAGFVSSISYNSAYWFLRPLPINFAYLRSQLWVKGAQSQFAHFEELSLNFSNLSFAIRVNLRHPWPSLFLYGLLLSLWCFSILANYYFQVSFHLKEILYVAQKRTKHRDWAPLKTRHFSANRAISTVKPHSDPLSPFLCYLYKYIIFMGLNH